jgi:NAD(P)-dependent dehydrogenase (short-subunit alcohol dehydrogenase family)
MRLQDRIALVTGGGQGIGRAIARMFAREGARVIIAARTADRLAKVKGEIEAEGGEVLAVPTDVGRDEDMERLFAAVQERFGGLDVLVNNAGVGMGAAVDQVDMKEYHRLMDTNLKGMYLGCKLGVPMMKKAGQGSIINISSVHGVDGSPMNTVYAATKGGIIGCTRALAAELAAFRIRVNTISPGAIWLERDIDAWLAPVKREHREEALRLFGEKVRDNHRYFQPLQVVGQTDDIAYCALYLASEESRFVTGQNIVVDGGLTTYLSGFAKEGAREKVWAAEEEMRKWFEEHKA